MGVVLFIMIFALTNNRALGVKFRPAEIYLEKNN